MYPVDIKTSVLVVAGKPQLIALDYCIDATADAEFKEKSLVYRSYVSFRISHQKELKNLMQKTMNLIYRFFSRLKVTVPY